MIEQRIKSLIEKRTIEAAKKEISKKLHVVVQAFGRPVIEQAMVYSDLPNYWEYDPPDVADPEDEHTWLNGYYFDGLSRGVNLCIKLTIYDGHIMNLSASYNGYTVFTESEGELKSYAPFPSWEDALTQLYHCARPVEQEKIKEERSKQKESNRKKALTLMQQLRLLWGV